MLMSTTDPGAEVMHGMYLSIAKKKHGHIIEIIRILYFR